MSDKTIARDWMTTALENMGQDGEDSLREGYSGRGMYGAECPAVVLDSSAQVAMFAVELSRQAMYAGLEEVPTADGDMTPARAVHAASDLCENTIDVVTNLFDNAREDSMGRGVVVYFPGWTLTD